MSHHSAPEYDILSYTNIDQETKNELENNSAIGGTGKNKQSLMSEQKAVNLSDNENFDDKEWLHADRGLQMGHKI